MHQNLFDFLVRSRIFGPSFDPHPTSWTRNQKQPCWSFTVPEQQPKVLLSNEAVDPYRDCVSPLGTSNHECSHMIWDLLYCIGRKFRNQTSDKMDNESREDKRRREKIKEEKEKKMQVSEKGRKVAIHCFSHDLWLRKVERSQKQQVRSHLRRWEMDNGTPLWREAHVEVKMHKTHRARTASGSLHVGKTLFDLQISFWDVLSGKRKEFFMLS